PMDRRMDGRVLVARRAARRSRAMRSISRCWASFASDNASHGCICMVLTSFLWSFVVVGPVLVDVVVERAAGEGHEHVLEARRAALPLGLRAHEPVPGVAV